MTWSIFDCCGSQVEEIRQLHYQHSMLNDVPPQVFAYERTLEELYLDANHIHDLPRPLFHCHGLKVLSLSDNEVQSLPPAIASLINLQHLDVSRNALGDIPDNIKGCKHLVFVDISVNPLEKLPEGFTQLISLEELYLNDTYLDYLPANFGRLMKLRILELRENNLNTLPKSIVRLKNLRRLDLGQNEFSDLPEIIGSLPNLTELWVDCNRIRGIPKFIGNLKDLVHLDASNNNIKWIANEIGNCTKLSDLTLTCNELTEVPETISFLKNLVTLKLDDNQLTTLPNSIGKLASLEELILSQNDFELIPPCVGLLRKLHILNIDDNVLEEIPPEIGSCTSLAILSACSNKLQYIPAEIGHLSNLRVLNLSENMLRNLPVSILNLTQLSALWLSNNQSMPLTTLQQEMDKETNQMVCVNFMLPQTSQTYSSENDNRTRQEILKSSSNKNHGKHHIRFASDAVLEEPGRLMRAPTPYPKELRAMAKHARAIQQSPKKSQKENDEGEPLLGEVIPQTPKDIVIKEAKVKKPATTPGLNMLTMSNIIKNNDILENGERTSEFSMYPIRSPSDIEFVDSHISNNLQSQLEESLPVVAVDSGPVVREAKCIRKINLANSNSDVMDQQPSFSSPPDILQQQPPPYHIAAAYSKQAAFFRQADNSYFPSPYKSLDMSADQSHDSQHISLLTSSIKDGQETPTNLRDKQMEPKLNEGKNILCLNSVADKNFPSDVSVADAEEIASIVQNNDHISELQENVGDHVGTEELSKLDELNPVNDDTSSIETSTEIKQELLESYHNDKYNELKQSVSPLSTADSDTERCSIKPPTFTQDKALFTNNVLMPTPHRPISGSTAQPTETSSLGAPVNCTSPTGHYFTRSSTSPVGKTPTRIPTLTSPTKQEHKLPTPNNWQPTPPTRSPVSSRIPQPGFYSNASSNYQSSKRSSYSSQTSGSRPGSISQPYISLEDSVDSTRSFSNKSPYMKVDYNSSLPKLNPNVPLSPNNIQNGGQRVMAMQDNSSVSKIPAKFSSSESPSPTSSRSPMSRIPGPMASSGIPVLKTANDSFSRQGKVWMFGQHKNATVFPVTIQKNPGLGFSIVGGMKPNEKYENGIFIAKVNPNGPAHGLLYPDDKILEVDGIDFTKLEHDHAVEILKQTSAVVNMMISRQQT